jgi:hypothetical protein
MKRITIAILSILFTVTVYACTPSQTSTDPAEVIQAYFEALGRGEVEAAQALVADDATANILGDVLTRKEQFREYNEEAVLDNPSFELSNIQVEGDKVSYTNKVTIGSQIFTLTSEAIVQEGKIVSIIDR